jgi:hypothetical protein
MVYNAIFQRVEIQGCLLVAVPYDNLVDSTIKSVATIGLLASNLNMVGSCFSGRQRRSTCNLCIFGKGQPAGGFGKVSELLSACLDHIAETIIRPYSLIGDGAWSDLEARCSHGKRHASLRFLPSL